MNKEKMALKGKNILTLLNVILNKAQIYKKAVEKCKTTIIPLTKTQPNDMILMETKIVPYFR